MNTVFFVGICMFVNTLMCGGSAFDTQLELEVKVLSEQGTPIVGANVKGGFKKRMGAGKPVIQNFLTDTNGIAQLSAKTSGQVAVEVTQKGYYTHYEDSDYFSLLRNGAISTNQTIRLKKIKNPIPMYVKQEEREIPNTKQFFGYDFEIGDWVAPYGKGKINDVLLFPQCTVTNEYNYSVQLTVKFPGEYNGITAMPREYAYLQGSKLRSLNIAPEDGFQDSLELFRWRKERKTNKGGFSENDREGYYFRIRSEVDEAGNLLTAQYGKIYGSFDVYGFILGRKTGLAFRYYYNPDTTRNVEFDPKQNLFLKGHKGRVPTCYSIGNP